MIYHTQYNYLSSSAAQAHVSLGIYRSKVAQTPDLIPAPLLSVREQFIFDANQKALKALSRHGGASVQFRRAIRSRWLQA